MKVKKYNVEIEYQVGKDNKKMSVKVNGKPMPMPPSLRRWIAEDYVRELFMKAKE